MSPMDIEDGRFNGGTMYHQSSSKGWLKKALFAAGLLAGGTGMFYGIGHRIATCRDDSTPNGATAVIQGDHGSLAPCPIFLMENGDVKGGFFRSEHVLNKLGHIDEDGTARDLAGTVRSRVSSDGDIYDFGKYGQFYVGKIKDNGRVKNLVDEVATVYDIQSNGTRTAGVNETRKKGLAVFGLGV